MSGGDDPHVNLGRSRGANLVDLALLDEPKNANLQFTRHLSDLIQKNGSSIGRFDPALLVSQGAGERSLHVAE